MSSASGPVLALVLRRFDYGETSQTGRLFTRSRGRLSVLAKGIKRPNANLRGPLDLFALAEVEIRLRPKGDLHLLTRYRVITGFPRVRRNLERIQAAFYLTEILLEGTRDLDPAPALFDATVRTLTVLEGASASDVPLIVAWFELGYLRLAGFLPSFDACVLCGRPAPQRGPVRLSLARAGLVCRRCLGERPTSSLFTVGDSLRRAVRELLDTQDPADAPEREPGSNVRAGLRALLPALVQHALEKELKAAGFVGAGTPEVTEA
jgi:DNA repair protein RecO